MVKKSAKVNQEIKLLYIQLEEQMTHMLKFENQREKKGKKKWLESKMEQLCYPRGLIRIQDKQGNVSFNPPVNPSSCPAYFPQVKCTIWLHT